VRHQRQERREPGTWNHRLPAIANRCAQCNPSQHTPSQGLARRQPRGRGAPAPKAAAEKGTRPMSATHTSTNAKQQPIVRRAAQREAQAAPSRAKGGHQPPSNAGRRGGGPGGNAPAGAKGRSTQQRRQPTTAPPRRASRSAPRGRGADAPRAPAAAPPPSARRRRAAPEAGSSQETGGPLPRPGQHQQCHHAPRSLPAGQPQHDGEQYPRPSTTAVRNSFCASRRSTVPSGFRRRGWRRGGGRSAARRLGEERERLLQIPATP